MRAHIATLVLFAGWLAGTGEAAAQIPGGIDGYVIEGSGGTALGYIEVTSTEIRWHWTSQSAAWPSSFTLTATGTAPSTSYTVTTERQVFPLGSGTYSMAGVQYQIKQDGDVVGYLKRGTAEHTWYSSEDVWEYAVGDLEFAPYSSSGSLTLWRLVDDVL